MKGMQNEDHSHGGGRECSDPLKLFLRAVTWRIQGRERTESITLFKITDSKKWEANFPFPQWEPEDAMTSLITKDCSNTYPDYVRIKHFMQMRFALITVIGTVCIIFPC